MIVALTVRFAHSRQYVKQHKKDMFSLGYAIYRYIFLGVLEYFRIFRYTRRARICFRANSDPNNWLFGAEFGISFSLYQMTKKITAL